MSLLANPWALVVFVGLIALASLLLAPRRITVDGFFDGASETGAPKLLTLVLSQVTTWIFARSLLTSAVLGYYYGVAGVLAYTAYYLSFLTGAFIVQRMRADYAGSVQDWLGDHYGTIGKSSYNVVVALRLLSEVFANLIVVGLIFTAAFPDVEWAGTGSIMIVAVVGLIYSALGGLRASLRTDVFQMLVFLVIFAIAFVVMVLHADFNLNSVLTAEGTAGPRAGWVLVAVAFLQVFSYPVHDPVMMDRGFIADEKTTRNSFLNAFWLSAVCIFGFGMFGIQAGIVGANADLLVAWRDMFGPVVYFFLAASLLVSAMSTLDSALSSSARLVVEELNLAPRTVTSGRIAMVVFMCLGACLTLWDNKTLFDAVAVSGTASMFLTPVLAIAFFGNRIVPLWSFLVAYVAALGGAASYLYRDTELVKMVFDGPHKYDQLLLICVAVLGIGFLAGLIGVATTRTLART